MLFKLSALLPFLNKAIADVSCAVLLAAVIIPPNLPKLLYIGFKLIPQIPYKIGV